MSVNSVIRSKLESLRATLDSPYTTASGSITWVDIPIKKVMQDNAQHPAEVSNDTTDINDNPVAAGKNNAFAYPIAYTDTDTFLSTFQQAEQDLEPVWLECTPFGRNKRICGGKLGYTVAIDPMAVPTPKTLSLVMFRGSAAGADPYDTILVSGGSGS